jgi:hypothetical protein
LKNLLSHRYTLFCLIIYLALSSPRAVRSNSISTSSAPFSSSSIHNTTPTSSQGHLNSSGEIDARKSNNNNNTLKNSDNSKFNTQSLDFLDVSFTNLTVSLESMWQ